MEPTLTGAGQMVERVSGQSLEDYFRDHIFQAHRNDGHKLRPQRQSEKPGCRHACATARWLLEQIDFLMEQKPEFFMGGGGIVFNGAGLSQIHPDFLARRPG